VQARSSSVTVDRADGEGAFAGGRLPALVDPGNGAGSPGTDARFDGSPGTDAVVVASVEGPGSVPEPEGDGCVQPVNDIAVAMSTATTMGTRLGMLVHPISTLWTSGWPNDRSCTWGHSAAAAQHQHRWHVMPA
jgi:hypothetical protein